MEFSFRMNMSGIHITGRDDSMNTTENATSEGSLIMGVYLTLSDIIWWTMKYIIVKGQ